MDPMAPDLQRTATVNGTRLAYVERGKGPPVVFVHGGLSDLRTWKHQLGPVSEAGYRAISYSRGFHWPNDPGDARSRPHPELFARELAGLLEALGTRPAHLVGNSYGALVCLHLALERPELVASLVLEEPPALAAPFGAFPPSFGGLAKNLLLHPRLAWGALGFGAAVVGPAKRAFQRGNLEEGMLRFVGGVLGLDVYRALPEERRQQMRDNVHVLAAEFLRGGFDPLSRHELRQLPHRVLLVEGDKTPAWLGRVQDYLASLLPNVTRATIREASHVMHEERPVEVNEAILGFLGAPRGRPAAEPVRAPRPASGARSGPATQQ